MIFQNNKDPLKGRPIWFKGGGSSGESYDAAYNARMASVAEAQQGMAQEYFDFWKSDYQPMEQAQIAANMELIPSETALSLAQNESALSLLPTQTEYSQATMEDAMTAMGEKAPVRSAFYQASLEGVDVNDRVNNAAADAAQSFMNTSEQSAREVARYGLSPDRLTSKINSNSLAQAKAVTSAKTQARTNAENENYQRLTTAMSY